jgi:hypothetical protein
MPTPILSTVSATNSGTAGASTVTQASYVVPSGTSALLAYAHVRVTTGTEWTGVVFNSNETFSQITAFTDGTARCGLYYLANPTATTADVFSVWNGTHSNARIAVRLVDQIDTAGTPYGTPAGVSGALTVNVTSAVDDMVIDVAQHSQSAGGATEGTDQVTDYINSTMGGSTFYAHASYQTATGSPTVMSRESTIAGSRVIVGVALKAVAAAGSGNVQPSKVALMNRLLIGKVG